MKHAVIRLSAMPSSGLYVVRLPPFSVLTRSLIEDKVNHDRRRDAFGVFFKFF